MGKKIVWEKSKGQTEPLKPFLAHRQDWHQGVSGYTGQNLATDSLNKSNQG